MSKRKIWTERGKSLLIILLLISAAMLLRQSVYYNFLKERLGSSDAESAVSDAAVSDAAAIKAVPSTILVSTAEGTRYGAAWDKEGVTEVFDSFSAALGEALGSASAPEAVEEDAWRTALTGDGVTVDFGSAHPLPLLAAWLGTSAAFEEEHSARLLCLVGRGEKVELYFRGEADGQYYRCTTAVSAAALRGRLENYRRTNACFAFEHGLLRDIEPNTVILDTLPMLQSISGTSAVDNGFDLETLFDALGMNAAAVKQYTESDGTRVYLENGRTVRIDAKGLISCKSGATDTAAAEGDERVAAVQTAYAFARGALAASAGAGELSFAGVETYGDGGYGVSFDYSVDGIAVELPGELCAASVTVKRGVVTQAELYPRTYTLGAEGASVLQMLQAAAAAAATGGEELRLVYLDSGADVTCVWVSD